MLAKALIAILRSNLYQYTYKFLKTVPKDLKQKYRFSNLVDSLTTIKRVVEIIKLLLREHFFLFIRGMNAEYSH